MVNDEWGKLGYNLLTQAYFLGIRLAAFRNEKAKLWVKGRVGVFEKQAIEIPLKRRVNQRLVWMHCASLGEFEQGRTIIEALKKQHPEVLVLLTFFSPSGYEIRKNYPFADWVFYLPADSKSNAQRFLALVKPDLAIFVKYEFWYHYLTNLKQLQIPTLLIAAIFRPTQPFFKWYGGLHRKMLSCFSEILVQDIGSQERLTGINFLNVQVAGDSRVDRVLEIAKHPKDLPLVKKFCGDAPVLVCGSTWPADEAILNPIFTHEKFKNWKFILAPHDVQPAHIQAIESKLEVPSCRFSQLENSDFSAVRLLLVDNIGLLSSLYFFGKIAYIGGGFGQGIHNTLEPAAYGLPVVFGPKYRKFEEAVWLVEHGGGFVVRDENELQEVLAQLTNPEKQSMASKAAKSYVQMKSGATQTAMRSVNSLLFG
ncbi:MAG: 3-deoxy-D-manno-octulosonic acid transferase [Saprospiraceae bacterium]|nr:3-deoxy-D-manno-octulosonic acid transferase [Saprospiraceae bacterium]